MVIFCTLLLGGLALLVSRFGHIPLRNTTRYDAAPRSHSVVLKWKASASRVVGYNVYRSDKSQGPYTKLNSSAVPTTTYTDVTVQAGHSYFYKVAAVDPQGHESVFSSLIRAVVPSP
jgi:fibronectin type 3 domain-containing protein